MVLVTDSGLIKNNVIKVDKIPSSSELLMLSNVLNDKLRDLSVEEINLVVINNLKKYTQGFEELFNSILSALYETLSEENYSDIHMEGTTNIFNYPEYNDISKAREFLSLIYNKDNMISLLDEGEDISIKIGEENFVKEAKDISFISAVYRVGNRPLGTIGVIGPTRMDYSNVTSIMVEVVNKLNTLLKNSLND